MSTERVIALARDVAAVAPMNKMKSSTTAKVPWSLVNALRDEMDAVGIDWRERHDEIASGRWRADGRGVGA